jgi:uncharacterized membrane protein YphA (DoxX/SURF4 family)
MNERRRPLLHSHSWVCHNFMPDQTSPPARTIAAVRIATGVLFFLFGEYKVASPAFAQVGFPEYLRGYIDGAAVDSYKLVLVHLVLPHTTFFGYFVGILELFIGLSLMLGLCVRFASVLGAVLLLNMVFASWWEPGHGVAIWRYFGAELDKIPLIFLFLIFYATRAGRTWGLDGFWHRLS